MSSCGPGMLPCTPAKDDCNKNKSYSSHPVRYSNGEIRLTEVDLEFNGLGRAWGQTRSYDNILIPGQAGPTGVNWYVSEIPYILGSGSYGYGGSGGNPATTVVVVGQPNEAVTYYLQGAGPQYTAQYNQLETLTYDAAASQYVWTDTAGRQMWFYAFDAGARAGKLRALVDAYGNITPANYDANGNLVSLLRFYAGAQSGFTYDYVAGGSQLALVTLVVNGVGVRRVAYTYYGASDPNGLPGDLQTVTIQTATDGCSWQTVKTSYYRYYVTNGSTGFQHGLKYAVGGQAYALMVAAGQNPLTASDATVAAYADYYFQYDGLKRVTTEATQGGLYTYTFAYTGSGASPGYNQWTTKTVETLPEGSTNKVYTNFAGQVLCAVYTSGSSNWYTAFVYDGSGRTLRQAESSAVASVSEATPGVATLQTGSGLIRVWTYYTAAGGPVGRVNFEGVQQGSAGTPVYQKEYIYQPVTVGSQTIYPVEMEVAYPTTSTLTGAATVYDYTFYPGTFQPQQKMTVWPDIATAQNGSNTSNARTEVFDINGNRTWLRDERGFLTNDTYDPATNGLVEEIADVNTALLPAPNGWTTPAGGGLHLITDYEVDYLGRPTQTLGPVHTVNLSGTATPVRRAAWTVYQDAQQAVWKGNGYALWTTPETYTLINPVSITQLDAAGRVIGQIEAARASTAGALSATDSLPQTGWSRWSAVNYNQQGTLVSRFDYFLIPANGSGTVGTNYLETDFGYDSLGRKVRTLSGLGGSGTGTVRRQVLNPMGWVLSEWVGTNDNGATPSDPTGGGATGNNMVMVTANVYDGGAVNPGGDGNLTQATAYASSSDARVTAYGYDFRNRRINADGEIDFYETYTYDNLNRLTETDRYNTTSGGNLIAKNTTAYDDLNRVYQQKFYAVDPSSGTAGNALARNLWYDPSGNVMLDQDLRDRGFAKMSYDGLNRVIASYAACNSSAQTYATAGTVAADTVVEQTLNTWDGANNLIFQTTSQRDHNATGNGALNGPAGAQPQARVSYVALYPDPLGRLITTANYGTNNGSAITTPAPVPPAPSDTILVSSNAYDIAGNLSIATDPQGTVTAWFYDNLGRVTQQIENYVPGASGTLSNRTTSYTYAANGKIGTLTAVNATTGNQVTTWNYGTTTSTSVIASNELLASKVMPDASSSAYLYNGLGQATQLTDANGTVRQFLYDKLGRLTDDKATTLGSGVDTTVQRISRTYEVRGLLQNVTSYTTPTGSTVVNDVQLAYNTFQQLANDYQSHSGAVNTSTTPNVAYAYASGSSNTVRLNTITYPNARVLTYGYGSTNSIDDLRDRIATLSDSLIGGTAATYTRLGRDRTVVVQYNEPNIEMTLVALSGEPSGDGGDMYTGLDRFGRVIDNRWINSSNVAIDRFKYTFSRASNRLTRQNVVAATNFDEEYGYGYGTTESPSLYQLYVRKRGTLSGGSIVIPLVELEQFLNNDATGNWWTYQTYAGGSYTLTQSRTANKVNEYTVISPSGPTGYDNNGNMTTMPQVDVWATAQTLTYDAWNRPITVKQGGTTLGTYAYDGLNRRTTKISTESGSTVTRHFYYSDQWQVLEERTGGSSSADRQYIWGVRYRDDLISRDRIGVDRLYSLADYFQTTSICNTSGVIQERYVYRAFGDVSYWNSTWTTQSSTSTYAWTYLYGGYQLDSETNLYQVRFRYYHSALGRWINRDPFVDEDGNDAELTQGSNLYWYVKNNAVNNVDPLGLLSNSSNNNPCVPLPDSGSGTFSSNVIFHKLGKEIGHTTGWGQASTLTFNVTCPKGYQYLTTYGVASTSPPPSPTNNNNTFPKSYQTVQEPTGNGPAYTIIIEVTSTQSAEHFTNYPGFVGTICIVGICCCLPSQGPPHRSDPPTLPGTYDPAPNPGNPIIPRF